MLVVVVLVALATALAVELPFFVSLLTTSVFCSSANVAPHASAVAMVWIMICFFMLDDFFVFR